MISAPAGSEVEDAGTATPDSDVAPTPQRGAKQRQGTGPETDPSPSVGVLPPGAPTPAADAWRRRIDELERDLARGKKKPRDADRLFHELETVLWPNLRDVHAAVIQGDVGFVDAKFDLDALYAQRDRLYSLISPELSGRLIGGGPVGRTALARELAYLRTSLLAQLRALEDGLAQIADNVSDAPMGTLWGVLQLALALVLFRGWRRWSKEGLASTRSRLIRQMSSRSPSLLLARLLWYLNRVNGPLSWLILLFVISRIVKLRGFEEIAGLVYEVLFWILVARLVVLSIDAMVVHGVGGLRSERRGPRLRSLRLVAGWSVLFGLGQSLLARYVGHGSIYALGGLLWQILSVPVAMLLVYWWKDEIFERLSRLADHSAWARRLAATRAGIWSYPVAVLGAAYLVWESIIRSLIRQLSRFEVGRRMLAVVVRHQVEQETLPESAESGEAIPPQILDVLLSRSADEPGPSTDEELQLLLGSVSNDRGGGFVVTGERGSGKTTLLTHLAKALGDEVCIVDCPTGGYEAFENALATAVGLSPGSGSGEQLPDAIEAAGIRVIALDNAHRLARPQMGGQECLDRVITLDTRLRGGVSWVLMIDRNAWRYILLARGEGALFQQVIELPRWTEEEIGEFVSARCRTAGIDPDYTRFVLPRQLDPGDFDRLEDRNRFGYMRILWELSDGNPSVAMRLFADSLCVARDGHLYVNLPQPRTSEALASATVDTLLVLRVIVQCDVASVEDIANSLLISPTHALTSVRYCLQNGWLQVVEGGVRIDWEWYRAITRLLERKNLMPR